MTLGTVRGALAGAAGTIALNGATYLEMAVRGRPASDSTQQLVEEVAARPSLPIPATMTNVATGCRDWSRCPVSRSA